MNYTLPSHLLAAIPDTALIISHVMYSTTAPILRPAGRAAAAAADGQHEQGVADVRRKQTAWFLMNLFQDESAAWWLQTVLTC
jgi:hypothetical protein